MIVRGICLRILSLSMVISWQKLSLEKVLHVVVNYENLLLLHQKDEKPPLEGVELLVLHHQLFRQEIRAPGQTFQKAIFATMTIEKLNANEHQLKMTLTA